MKTPLIHQYFQIKLLEASFDGNIRKKQALKSLRMAHNIPVSVILGTFKEMQELGLISMEKDRYKYKLNGGNKKIKEIKSTFTDINKKINEVYRDLDDKRSIELLKRAKQVSQEDIAELYTKLAD